MAHNYDELARQKRKAEAELRNRKIVAKRKQNLYGAGFIALGILYLICTYELSGALFFALMGLLLLTRKEVILDDYEDL